MIGGEANDRIFDGANRAGALPGYENAAMVMTDGARGRGQADAALRAYVNAMIQFLDPEPGREGLAETPRRVVESFRELTSGYFREPSEVFTTFDGEGYDEMILQTDLPFYSLCEHHLLPFAGRAHIGYIPSGPIVGLSKIARVLEIFARRFQNQERITNQVADAMFEGLDPLGVIVILEAEHFCMTMRGVKVAGSTTTTSALRGVFKDKPATRAEALSLIDRKASR